MTQVHMLEPVLIECSIIPCLALKGVAAAIARSSKLRVKVLLCEYFM